MTIYSPSLRFGTSPPRPGTPTPSTGNVLFPGGKLVKTYLGKHQTSQPTPSTHTPWKDEFTTESWPSKTSAPPPGPEIYKSGSDTFIDRGPETGHGTIPPGVFPKKKSSEPPTQTEQSPAPQDAEFEAFKKDLRQRIGLKKFEKLEKGPQE